MSINLLPWREMNNKKYAEKLLIAAIIYTLFIFCGMIVAKNVLSHKMAELSARTTRTEINSQKIILTHQKQHAILLQKLKLLFAKKSISVADNNKITHLLSAIANDLPSDMTLHSLSLNKQQVILTGVSNQLSDIHQYITALQQNTSWKNIQLFEMHNDPSNKSQMDFTIQVTL